MRRTVMLPPQVNRTLNGVTVDLTISIPICPDSVPEPGKSFQLKILPGLDYGASVAPATITIEEGDKAVAEDAPVEAFTVHGLSGGAWSCDNSSGDVNKQCRNALRKDVFQFGPHAVNLQVAIALLEIDQSSGRTVIRIKRRQRGLARAS